MSVDMAIDKPTATQAEKIVLFLAGRPVHYRSWKGGYATFTLQRGTKDYFLAEVVDALVYAGYNRADITWRWTP